MSSLEGRFTAHFSPEERELLRRRAADEATSENYYVRLGLRFVLGLPIPRRVERELARERGAEHVPREQQATFPPRAVA